MISLWRHNHVIFEKSVKRQALSTKIHIPIDLKSQIIKIFVHITNIAYCFLI